MKRILVKSVFDCFDYVLDYRGNETFAIISIQDPCEGGFGFRFVRTKYCRDVLTLQFDDAEIQTEETTLFTPEQARMIIDFIIRNEDRVDTLLIHCYGGQSRSVAVGAFASQMMGQDDNIYLKGTPNRLVYKTLIHEYNKYLEE